ncbi:hypothetical protein ZWY2020_045541, partial [Hordeum vulgare]
DKKALEEKNAKKAAQASGSTSTDAKTRTARSSSRRGVAATAGCRRRLFATTIKFIPLLFAASADLCALIVYGWLKLSLAAVFVAI